MTKYLRTAAAAVALAALTACGTAPTTPVPAGMGSTIGQVDQGTAAPTTDTGMATAPTDTTPVDQGATPVDQGTLPGTDVGMNPDPGTGTVTTPPVDQGPIIGPEPDGSRIGGGGGGGIATTPTEAPNFYLAEVVRSHIGLMKVATLADQKTSDPAVRTYAQSLLAAHQQAYDAAAALARDKRVAISAVPTSEATSVLDRMGSTRDVAFDEVFVRGTVALSKALAEMADRQAASTADPDVQDLAADFQDGFQDLLEGAMTLAAGDNVDLSIGYDGRPLAVSANDGQNTASAE